jgi:predicted DNA-binding transcriptional regulator YafY
MRRADRLFELVQRLRARRLTTAAQLASGLGVSLRTVYRDVADLQHRGVPIEGEAGVGYRLQRGYTLPPLMFTAAQAQALVAAVRMAQPRMDAPLAAETEAALGKIIAVLPAAERAAAESLALFAPDPGLTEPVRQALGTLRVAVAQRSVVAFNYVDERGSSSQRCVWPLGCFFWGAVWTLAAWCELRQDFRSFRLDRIEALQALERRYPHEPGRTLADLLRRFRSEHDSGAR